MFVQVLPGTERSIPAGAGEPWLDQFGRVGGEVYPRGCGGTMGWMDPVSGTGGLSPRVRGNPRRNQRRRHPRRSIPAGAGEPVTPCAEIPYGAVYPRGCGGTVVSRYTSSKYAGLSPRVRGNPDIRRNSWECARSIPAGAGEPDSFFSLFYWQSVYPRGCGGTVNTTVRNLWAPGLSPRVRGNQTNLG